MSPSLPRRPRHWRHYTVEPPACLYLPTVPGRARLVVAAFAPPFEGGRRCGGADLLGGHHRLFCGAAVGSLLFLGAPPLGARAVPLPAGAVFVVPPPQWAVVVVFVRPLRAGAVVVVAPPLWAVVVSFVRPLRAGAVVVIAPPLPADLFLLGAPPLRAAPSSTLRRRCGRANSSWACRRCGRAPFILGAGPPFWAATMSSPGDHPPTGVDDMPQSDRMAPPPRLSGGHPPRPLKGATSTGAHRSSLWTRISTTPPTARASGCCCRCQGRLLWEGLMALSRHSACTSCACAPPWG